MDPQPPTSSLPLLQNITSHSLTTITTSLINLRVLYWPVSLPHTTLRNFRWHVKERIPDSGYASAEDDDDGDDERSNAERIMLLREDVFERAFAVRWLTGFIARSEDWVEAVPVFPSKLDHVVDPVKERENRSRVVEEAASLLALYADTRADGALARRFSFAVKGGGDVVVELTDEPYDEYNHEGVGLQTWGSACVLARRVCAEPDKFLGLDCVVNGRTMQGKKIKVLELGAGTGLLSMVIAKLQLQQQQQQRERRRAFQLEVVATDFHAAVLENLRKNVARNFSCFPEDDAVWVDKLDWTDLPNLEERDKYDIIFGADVIYDKRHAAWIKDCAVRMLKREKGRVMWLMVPRRPTRTCEVNGVDDVFGREEGKWGLRIIEVEDVPRCSGVGRADEIGYRLFTVGWGK